MNISVRRDNNYTILSDLDPNIKTWQVMNMLQLKQNERLSHDDKFLSPEYSLKEHNIASDALLVCEQHIGLVFTGSMVMAKIF
jgi:hypothetical protein